MFLDSLAGLQHCHACWNLGLHKQVRRFELCVLWVLTVFLCSTLQEQRVSRPSLVVCPATASLRPHFCSPTSATCTCALVMLTSHWPRGQSVRVTHPNNTCTFLMIPAPTLTPPSRPLIACGCRRTTPSTGLLVGLVSSSSRKPPHQYTCTPLLPTTR